MKPRITLSLDRDDQIEIWINEAGRDALVQELQALSPQNDHFHLQPEGFQGVPTQSRGYRDGDHVLDWGKVLFRPDEWDQRFFPHVLDESSPKRTEAQDYGTFMSGLLGVEDDAQLAGYSPEATALLRRAVELFWREFRERHPDAWGPKDRSQVSD